MKLHVLLALVALQDSAVLGQSVDSSSSAAAPPIVIAASPSASNPLPSAGPPSVGVILASAPGGPNPGLGVANPSFTSQAPVDIPIASSGPIPIDSQSSTVIRITPGNKPVPTYSQPSSSSVSVPFYVDPQASTSSAFFFPAKPGGDLSSSSPSGFSPIFSLVSAVIPPVGPSSSGSSSSFPFGNFPSLSTSTGSASSTTTGQLGFETVSIVSLVPIRGIKRQFGLGTAVASIAICPIYPTQVPDAPCYPCAVGTPLAGESLQVVTASTLAINPDPTPIFEYSFVGGDGDGQPTRVTTPVPGYTPGSRDFGSCLVQAASSSSSTRPTFPLEQRSSSASSASSASHSSITRRATTTSSRAGFPFPSGFFPFPGGLTIGFTTNIYVSITAINIIQVSSICPDGHISTIWEASSTCYTTPTKVVIPTSLCSTYVTTHEGSPSTVVTPLPSWTECLTTLSTKTTHVASTITVQSTQTLESCVPPGYTPTDYVPTATPVPGNVVTTVIAGKTTITTMTADAIGKPGPDVSPTVITAVSAGTTEVVTLAPVTTPVTYTVVSFGETSVTTQLPETAEATAAVQLTTPTVLTVVSAGTTNVITQTPVTEPVTYTVIKQTLTDQVTTTMIIYPATETTPSVPTVLTILSEGITAVVTPTPAATPVTYTLVRVGPTDVETSTTIIHPATVAVPTTAPPPELTVVGPEGTTTVVVQFPVTTPVTYTIVREGATGQETGTTIIYPATEAAPPPPALTVVGPKGTTTVVTQFTATTPVTYTVVREGATGQETDTTVIYPATTAEGGPSTPSGEVAPPASQPPAAASPSTTGYVQVGGASIRRVGSLAPLLLLVAAGLFVILF